jgi:hypothetical protein
VQASTLEKQLASTTLDRDRLQLRSTELEASTAKALAAAQQERDAELAKAAAALKLVGTSQLAAAAALACLHVCACKPAGHALSGLYFDGGSSRWQGFS